MKAVKMKAVVVYESLWGNTAQIACAIAEGLGGGACALSTAEASAEVVAEADLIVAGAPVLAFSLPTEKIRDSLVGQQGTPAPDLSSPSMRSWLSGLAPGTAGFTAFETRVRFSPGGATGGIVQAMQKAGFRLVAKPARFFVKGRVGPLREGEVERAREWGVRLAEASGASPA